MSHLGCVIKWMVHLPHNLEDRDVYRASLLVQCIY